MEKRNIIGIIVVVFSVLVVGGIVFVAMQRGGVQKASGPDTVLAPGASTIKGDGQVVTKEGTPVKLNIEPGSPEAPSQSNPIAKTEVPTEAIKIEVFSGGFKPADFSVSPGEAVSVSITSTDTQSHVFKFDSDKLSAVAVGVGPGETRLISFNAPSKGEYSFFCDVPGHKKMGEVGKMIVN